MTSCFFMTQILTIHVIFTNADSTLLRHGVWERLWQPWLLFGRRLCAQKSPRRWVLSDPHWTRRRTCNQKCFRAILAPHIYEHEKLAICMAGIVLDGFLSPLNFTVDYEHYFHCISWYNLFSWFIMSVGPGDTKFWTRHLGFKLYYQNYLYIWVPETTY